MDDSSAVADQVVSIVPLEGDPEVTRQIVRTAFTDELLATIERACPGRTRLYMETVDQIMSILYALTQPEDSGGIGVLLPDDATSLRRDELHVLLTGMANAGLISQDGDGGFRITHLALSRIGPMPQESLNG